MRRAQSVRHYARPSLALGTTDDLGVLREDESNEDALRRQLLDKDRENDRVGGGSIHYAAFVVLITCSCKRKYKYYRPNLLSVRH